MLMILAKENFKLTQVKLFTLQKTPVIEGKNLKSLITREFKTKSIIGREVKNRLNYITFTFMCKIKSGKERGIPECEILYVVLDSENPQFNLLVYLDTLPRLNITIFHQIIWDYFKEKTTA